MIAAAIAASSAREMVLVIPMPFGLHSGKHLSEGGKRLIRCLALLHSFGGCQKRLCCTPFHEVGIAYVSFLGDEAKRGVVFWVISHQCSVGTDALVFSVG